MKLSATRNSWTHSKNEQDTKKEKKVTLNNQDFFFVLLPPAGLTHITI